MLQTVVIKNITGYSLTIGSHTISAYGKLVLPYPSWAVLVLSVDMSAYAESIVVDAPSLITTCSVADFGAVGDGFADDTLAFQNAVDYIAEAGGGVVSIPSGLYYIGVVSVGVPIIFDGTGDTSVLKQAGASLFSFTNAGACGVSNLLIHSDATPLLFNACTNALISNCTVNRKSASQYVATVAGGSLICNGNVYIHVGTNAEYRYNLSDGAKVYETGTIERVEE